jgi:hypothetical protein
MSDEFFDPFAAPIDTSDVTPETVHEGGGGQVAIAGFYHVRVQSVEYKREVVEGTWDESAENGGSDCKRKLPHYKIVLVALGGEHPSEIEKKIYHSIYLAKWSDRKDGEFQAPELKAWQSIIAFLYAFGTVGEEVFGNANAKLSHDNFMRLENCQAVAKVDIEEHNGKPQARIQWNNDVWPLNHDHVKDVPKDVEAMQYAMTGVAAADELDDI